MLSYLGSRRDWSLPSPASLLDLASLSLEEEDSRTFVPITWHPFSMIVCSDGRTAALAEATSPSAYSAFCAAHVQYSTATRGLDWILVWSVRPSILCSSCHAPQLQLKRENPSLDHVVPVLCSYGSWASKLETVQSSPCPSETSSCYPQYLAQHDQQSRQ